MNRFTVKPEIVISSRIGHCLYSDFLFAVTLRDEERTGTLEMKKGQAPWRRGI